MRTQTIPFTEQGRGATILTLGILSILLAGFVLGIVAWVMGSRDLRKIDEGRIPEHERGKTRAGMVLGIIAAVGRPLGVVLVVGFLLGWFQVA